MPSATSRTSFYEYFVFPGGWSMFFSRQRADLKQAIALSYLLIWSVCSDSQQLAPWHLNNKTMSRKMIKANLENFAHTVHMGQQQLRNIINGIHHAPIF